MTDLVEHELFFDTLEAMAANLPSGSLEREVLRLAKEKITHLVKALGERDARVAELTNSEIKAIWRKHGGKQHGPMVEHYTIEEGAFYRFARELIATTLGEMAP